jgi:methanogenic corrinoid protein MtbC1
MMKNDNLESLIGDLKNIPVMLDNHRNHIAFISIVMKTGNTELLETTLPWVYHSYHSQGFSYNYFSTVLKLWREAVESIILLSLADPILALYDRMIELHEETIKKSESFISTGYKTELTPAQQRFSDLLITGCQRTIFSLTDEYFEEGGNLKDFYHNLVTPAMYNIGRLWENGHISVAEEHLASSIVSRILATHYSRIELPELTSESPRIMICASANEYHEIGAWMIANLFEAEGWDVNYLGANTPINDIEQLVLKYPPDILGISVTMAFNLDKAVELIKGLKEKVGESTGIMVGGNLFSSFPGLENYTQADFTARNFDDALNFANTYVR